VADDELLPVEESGAKVRVPTNTKLQATDTCAAEAVTALSGDCQTPSEDERRGEGRTSMPVVFN
jgi:hypothetical protein